MGPLKSDGQAPIIFVCMYTSQNSSAHYYKLPGNQKVFKKCLLLHSVYLSFDTMIIYAESIWKTKASTYKDQKAFKFNKILDLSLNLNVQKVQKWA